MWLRRMRQSSSLARSSSLCVETSVALRRCVVVCSMCDLAVCSSFRISAVSFMD